MGNEEEEENEEEGAAQTEADGTEVGSSSRVVNSITVGV